MDINSYREDEQIQCLGKKETIKRLFKHLFNYKKEVILVLLCMGVAIAITLINPLLVQRAIDVHIAKKDIKSLIVLGIIGIIINILYIMMVKIRMNVMAKVSNKILLDIRNELYIHIQKLSFSFFDKRPTGKILARIIGDVNSLKQVLSNAVTILIPDFITVVGVIVIMLVKNYKLALASLCTIPIMIIAVWCMQKLSHVKWQIFRKKSSNLNAYVHESVAGIKVVKSYSAEEETQDIFASLVQEQEQSFVNAVKVSDLFSGVVDICWGVGIVLLYLTGINMLEVSDITVGTLIAFGTYIGMFWNPVMNLSNFYNQIVTNLTAAQRIFEILDTQPDIDDELTQEGIKKKELGQIKGSVELRNVSFAYDKKSKNVLENVNLKVNPGETIALVGPTGAGKSTIINLISRFYDVTKGQVLVDGHDVREVTLKSLRKQIGVMTQDNFIFKGTIKDNIEYGKVGASMEEIIAAAKAVGAHSFIVKLDKGYETEIKDGLNLSAGQRQLIALARTMLSKPNILILDEATSSIDTKTEIQVQKGIDAILENRTSFIVAHRLSTIQNADRILVINDKNIQEEGTHEELLKKKGFYYNLYKNCYEA